MKIGPVDLDTNTTLTIVGVLALVVGGFFFGRWTQQDTLQELADRANQAAERAETVEVEYKNYRGEMQRAYQRLTFNYLGEEEINEELERRNEGLARRLSSEEATNTRLVQAMSELRLLLAGMDPVDETDSTFVVAIDKERVYERGLIGVDGTVTIRKASPDSANTELNVSVNTSPILVWQRNEDGTSSVTLDYGDMPIVVDSLYGAENVEDPIHDDARGSLFDVIGKTGFVIGGIGALVGVISVIF